MPTSYPPRKEPLLASVEPPPVETPASPAPEPDDDDDTGTEDATAAAGGLHFTIDARELLGAINLLRRVSVLADEHLGLVEIECERHVILRVGDTTQFVELRFGSTRCVSTGRATVQTR